MPFKHSASRRHCIPKIRRRITNRPTYEAGLRRRGDLTFWLDEAALASWTASRRTTRGGQPLYADMANELVLTLRLVFHLALRQAEGCARSVLRLLGLDLSVRNHSTLSHRGRAFAGRQPRAANYDGPVHVALDSTGLQVFGQGEWDAEKRGRTPRRWRELHLAINAATGEIVAHVPTDKDVGDMSAVPALLATVKGPIGSVIADGGYDGRTVYEAAAIRQLHPLPDIVVPPRASSVLNVDAATPPNGSGSSCPAHRGEGPHGVAEGSRYGRRSLIEAAIGRYKHIIGSKLCARLSNDQQGEVAIAIQILNRMIRSAKPISSRSS